MATVDKRALIFDNPLMSRQQMLRVILPPSLFEYSNRTFYGCPGGLLPFIEPFLSRCFWVLQGVVNIGFEGVPVK